MYISILMGKNVFLRFPVIPAKIPNPISLTWSHQNYWELLTLYNETAFHKELVPGRVKIGPMKWSN
jgi:hypothetical protein